MNSDFSPDWMKGYQGYVADLLDGAVPVLIYAGDVDFVCNWIGNKAWTLDFEWSGKESFNSAADAQWVVDGSLSGERRTADGLTFLRIFDAGHMVPLDKPAESLEMVRSFFAGFAPTDSDDDDQE